MWVKNMECASAGAHSKKKKNVVAGEREKWGEGGTMVIRARAAM